MNADITTQDGAFYIHNSGLLDVTISSVPAAGASQEDEGQRIDHDKSHGIRCHEKCQCKVQICLSQDPYYRPRKQTKAVHQLRKKIHWDQERKARRDDLDHRLLTRSYLAIWDSTAAATGPVIDVQERSNNDEEVNPLHREKEIQELGSISNLLLIAMPVERWYESVLLKFLRSGADVEAENLQENTNEACLCECPMYLF